MSELVGGNTTTISNNTKVISNSVAANNTSVTTNSISSKINSILTIVFNTIGKVVNKTWYVLKRMVLPTIITVIVMILALKYGVLDDTPGLKALAQACINLVDAIAGAIVEKLANSLQGRWEWLYDILFPALG